MRQGWLKKKSGGIISRWQSRFVTYKHRTLILRHDATGIRCKVYDVKQSEAGSTDTDFRIVCLDGRVLDLRAQSKAERETWITALQEPPDPPQHQQQQQQQQKLTQQQHLQHQTLAPTDQGHGIYSSQPDSVGSRPAAPANVAPTVAARPGNLAVAEKDVGESPRAVIPPVEPSSTPSVSLFSKGGKEFRTQAYLAGQYTGEFLKGERHGMGRFEYNNGNLYTGSWEGDKKNGFGSLRWTNKDVYVGNWQDNKMWGYGVFQYANGNVFIGAFVADNKEGYGKFAWAIGDIYEGEWRKDAMNGRGVTRYKNGNVHTGECRNNVKHGKGKMEWASGDVYEGEWRDGLIEGVGIFTYQDGGRYEGEWHKDQRHGQGTMKQANGDICTGTWMEDLRNGSGTCQYNNNDQFVGNFAENLREGWGVYTAAPMRMLGPDGEVREIKGDQYSGNWHKDKKHGYGRYVWSDGDVYEGHWEQDLRNGEGTCTYSNKDKYVGEWKDDMRHGWGRLVWADGNTFEGAWKNDNIAPGSKGIVPPASLVAKLAKEKDTKPARALEHNSGPSTPYGQLGVPRIAGLQDSERMQGSLDESNNNGNPLAQMTGNSPTQGGPAFVVSSSEEAMYLASQVRKKPFKMSGFKVAAYYQDVQCFVDGCHNRISRYC